MVPVGSIEGSACIAGESIPVCTKCFTIKMDLLSTQFQKLNTPDQRRQYIHPLEKTHMTLLHMEKRETAV